MITHKLRYLLSLSLPLLALTACEINRLNSATDHFNKKRYAAAIQEVDQYIAIAKNGALVARSEDLRSDSYYELGLIAKERESWDLAIRFLKLANSEEADLVLGDIYKLLAGKALTAGNPGQSLDYVNDVIREMPESPLVPEMLARRINFALEVFVDHESAWADYMWLFDSYPNNSYELAARKQIMRIIPGRVEYARRLYNTGYYSEGLKILFELGKYPVVETTANNKMISEAYMGQAESFLNNQDYIEADRFFRIAVQYDPGIQNVVKEKLDQVASLFIKRGDSYLAQRDFDNALAYYQRTFDIVPDHPQALRAIENLNSVRASIARAAELGSQAEKAELAGRYGEALNLYRQANNLDGKQEYRNKAGQMQNMLDAQANPEAFAARVIREYRGGILNARIQKLKNDLLLKYKKEEIRDSGWKFLISTGQYKYEVRYDLITPVETYFYVWQVNLKDRVITPLNTVSETLMR